MRVTRITPVDPLDIQFIVREHGTLVMRPTYYVHTLEVIPESGIHPRHVVEALTQFANGFAIHARDHAPPGGFAPSEIIFHVARDNAKMRAYVESKGATAEDAILYRLPL